MKCNPAYLHHAAHIFWISHLIYKTIMIWPQPFNPHLDSLSVAAISALMITLHWLRVAHQPVNHQEGTTGNEIVYRILSLYFVANYVIRPKPATSIANRVYFKWRQRHSDALRAGGDVFYEYLRLPGALILWAVVFAVSIEPLITGNGILVITKLDGNPYASFAFWYLGISMWVYGIASIIYISVWRFK